LKQVLTKVSRGCLLAHTNMLLPFDRSHLTLRICIERFVTDLSIIFCTYRVDESIKILNELL
jgi:hypothetical protein